MVECIVTVVLEVVKRLASPTERQINYLLNYDENLENLKNEIKELEGERESVQHKVDEAKRRGEEIEDIVETWFASVNKLIDEEHNFPVNEAAANNRCFIGLCPNLKTRYQHSKEAVRLLEAIGKLREAGRFDRVGYRTIPEDIQLMPNKEYEAFESRLSTLKNVLAVLKNPDVNMLGIYGMGGIGKTTLAKEVARQAEIDKLFDQVVFAEVSQRQDIRKIQGEIADKLGLTFHEESESGRARSLCDRLKKEKKMLLILDNIWEPLDLQDVGIPHGDDHKGCKVLLTARSEDTLLRKMDSQQNFLVGVLDKKESWSLFKKMAGDYIEGSEIKSIAVDVANECAGLPVSIVTVAKALRKKKLFEWNDALQQLKRPFLTNFKDVQPAAYSAIELSYNKLEGEELKKIFLLIGYTYVKSIRQLLMYGVGLGLFEGIDRMEEAQARVRSLICKLKASCMLLDHISGDEEWFSMHDVVRDVAISIASTQQNVFTRTHGQLVNPWKLSDESAVKFYTSIVLHNVKTSVLPEELNCPHLELFYVEAAKSSSIISDNFFIKVKQVRVLALKNMNLRLLPSSLGLLINLRTLCLYDCKLQDISGIGGLKKLEILWLWDEGIEQLPVEIGQLTQLKLLDLSGCWKLKIIPPNVLSNLSHLEELYMVRFEKWGKEVEGLKNASLDELKLLRNLTSLELRIDDINTLSRGLFFEKLERYKIFIGCLRSDDHKCCRRIFQLRLNTDICLKDGLIVQLQGIEVLWLDGLQEHDVKYFVDELVKLGSSRMKMKMKHLALDGCSAPNPRESKESVDDIILEDDVNILNPFFNEKVVLPNLETLELSTISNIDRIWQNQVIAMSFGIQKLTQLIINDCRNLTYLFSSSIVTYFVQLQKLYIRNCPFLKELIVMDQEEMKNITFPQLQVLEMRRLSKLNSFCSKDPHIEFPSLKKLQITNCPKFMMKYKSSNPDLTKKKWKESTSDMQSNEIILEDDVNVPTSLFNEKHQVFPNLKDLAVEEKHMPWVCQLPDDFLRKLKCLYVKFDESTTILSLDDFLQRLPNVKIIDVCGDTYSPYKKSNINGMALKITEATKCCDLKHILKKESSILDNLEMLLIFEWDNLINLVPSRTSFQNLTTLWIEFCNGLRNVLTTSTAKSLMRLREMEIYWCNMITEIVADDEGDNAAKDEIVFSELKELRLLWLTRVTSFCSGICAFKFPSLETLVVTKCPNMKVFSRGELRTPKLHKVQTNRWEEDSGIWEHDLNTTIQQLYRKTKGAGADREETDKSIKENNADASESQIFKEDLGQPSMQHLE